MPVSLEAIQSIIGKTQEIPDGFLTTKQWCKELGVVEKRMLSILHQLGDQGCLEVGTVIVKSISNKRSSVPAYKINLPKGKK